MSSFKIRKKQIDQILKKYTISEIETALIEGFLEKNDISNVKNKFVVNSLKKSKNSSKINSYLKEVQFEFSLKNIERFFELLIPTDDRSINGAFYTPNFIVDYIIEKTITSDQSVCDPSCGSGAFLVSATEKIMNLTGKKTIKVLEENIFGCDILDYNIRRTKIILSLLAIKNGEDIEEIKFNLKEGDSLRINWNKEFPGIFKPKNNIQNQNGFDVVIGNPPYVRIQDLKNNLKEHISKNYSTVGGGNFNLYFVFFELGMSILKDKGLLGYIVPNNFFTSFAAENLRGWLQENKFLKEIVDFTHLLLFQDALTYTCITILSKEKKNNFLYNFIDDKKSLEKFSILKSDKILFTDIKPKKWRLLKDKDFHNIKKIETIGVPLGIKTKINSGIATLKDQLYFLDEKDRKNGQYEKFVNNKKYLISSELVREVIKISDMNTDEDIKVNTRRIIFPYKKTIEGFELIPKEEMRKKYSDCYDYFLAVKDKLEQRDKGKRKYAEWYAYGRGQAFDVTGKKLLTPTFSKNPKFMLDNKGDSFFCNGYAISKSELDLKILQKILNSSIMNYYIRHTSVQVGGGFPCFQKNFIERFTVPEFDKKELDFLSKESNQDKINKFLEKKYDVAI